MDFNNMGVKTVALYLRKSRGDDDSVLVKHENILIEICKKHGWRYVKYKEIGTSDSINLRPKMLELLKEVEKETYDAVLVVDYDRLGRGELEDQGRIKNVFSKSDTFIITPQRLYDLNNDDDNFYSDVQGIFARQEYRMIKKRFRRGKREGAKLGKWTNGSPPIPYVYDPINKQLNIDEEQLKIYRYIIENALEGVGTSSIAWDLNKQGIRTKNGYFWHPTSIYRILIDETQLGKIVTNKTQGSGHKKQKPSAKPYAVKTKDEWIIVENCHAPVKTQEEHDKIMHLLKTRKKVPPAARAGRHPLSGIIRCGICGHSIQIQKKSNSKKDSVKCCQHYNPYGDICENRGGLIKPIYDYIIEQIDIYGNEIKNALEEEGEVNNSSINSRIDETIKIINRKKYALERIDEAFEAGVYSLQKRNERFSKVEGELEELKKELTILENKVKDPSKISRKKRLQQIEEFKKQIKNQENPTELNALYRSIIDEIIWKRVGDDEPEVHINFP